MGNECAICAVPYWTFGHTDWAFAAVSDPSFNKNKPTSHAVTLPTKHIVDFGEFFEGDNYRYRTDMDTMTLATIIGQFELGNRFFQLLENLSPNRSVAHIHRHILGAPTVEAALIAQNLEGTPIEIMTGDLTLGMYFTEERRFLDRETLGIMDTSDAKEFATIESFKVRLDTDRGLVVEPVNFFGRMIIPKIGNQYQYQIPHGIEKLESHAVAEAVEELQRNL